jgi:CRISPR-associated protein Csh2
MSKEILFYYESMQNPNGDPGFENQPRLMPDDTIIVTDVRIKRTMRDYARDHRGETLFVDYDKNGEAITADGKAQEIVGDLKKKDVIKELLLKTFDVPLFGALVPIRSKESSGDSEKITGPLQFAISRSVNKVEIIKPTIVGRFVGKETDKKKQFSTFGSFYSVEYALIKVHGTMNQKNLIKYESDKEVMEKFQEKASMINDCIWNGTNRLVTRSKYPQRSIFYIEVNYKNGKIYNDLPILVKENERLLEKVKSLGERPFDFSKMIEILGKRKSEIDSIKIRGAEDIVDNIADLKSQFKKKGIDVVELAD